MLLIERKTDHGPGDHLEKAVRGHAAILAAIHEHAAARQSALEALEREAASADLERRQDRSQ